MNAAWKSQRFDAEGSTTAAGILRQLGRPSLDEFTVLVREAAQNSWDARRGDSDVHFAIRVERLGDRAATWRELLLPGPPALSIEGFEDALSPDACILVISDRGTQGLSGPVRATERPAPGERNDFVQFLRNVGEPRDSELGGGTYGFGKGIFYRTSAVRTILAHSRIKRGGSFEERLMGAALGSDYYDASDRRFTGRHWWGHITEDIVDPATGFAAADIAAALALPAFDADQTGTNIVVLGADLALVAEHGTPEFANTETLGSHLASAMLWNLWPKFRATSRDAEHAMTFSVHVDGTELAIPSPLDVPALKPFVQAFHSLEGGSMRSYRRSAPPRIHCGDIAVGVAVTTASEPAVVHSARPFDGAPRHVARMRQAGLIVDYVEGPSHPDALFCYGGVFRSSGEADSYFAEAEPPTHDRWNPEGLGREARLVVQGAIRFIREDLTKRFGAQLAASGAHSSNGLGNGSRRLSGLVAGIDATGADPVGAGPRVGGPRIGGASAIVPARLIGDPWVALYGEALAIFSKVRVEAPAALTSVKACIDVVLDGGGREGEPPPGVSTPRVIRWLAANTRGVVRDGDVLDDFAGQQDWIVVAEFSDDAVTRLRLELVRAPDGT